MPEKASSVAKPPRRGEGGGGATTGGASLGRGAFELLESFGDVVADFAPGGRLHYASPGHAALFGFERVELEGRTGAELTELLAVEPVPLEPGDAVERPVRFGVRTRSGKRRSIACEFGSYDAQDGTHLVVRSRDVTDALARERELEEDARELRAAESHARASQRRLRQILNSIPATQIIVWGLDCRARAVYSGTRPESYGLTADRAVGSLAGELLPEQRQEQGLANVRSVLETGEPRVVREVVPLPAGSFVFDVAISPLRDDGGEISSVISVCHDVTERVQQEAEQARLRERLESAERLERLGLLAGGVAHDFNNLLLGIQNVAEGALARPELPATLRSLFETIAYDCGHAADLTERLLAYSGQREVDAIDIELGALVSEMERLLESSLPPGVPLSLERSDRAASVRADPVQLRQVLLNLARNAGEASERGQRVAVRVGVCDVADEDLSELLSGVSLEPGAHAYLEVEDDGAGIAAEELDQIFDPFFTKKAGGRGLGLSTVMGIVRAHGGALRVRSSPGEGTAMRVLMPLCESPRPEPTPPGPVPESSERSILVVDDSRPVRDAAVAAVRQAGYAPIAAASGAQAVELLGAYEDRIVAVLLDLVMPGMDGEQTLRALRAVRDVPVVLMSGRAEETVQERLKGEGNVCALRKPFSVASLVDALSEVVDLD